MLYDAWEKLRGTPKQVAQRTFISLVDQIFNDAGKGRYLENPYWPGPNYYDECKKFSWVEVLVD